MESSIGNIVENVINMILNDYKKLRETEKNLEAAEEKKIKENNADKKQIIINKIQEIKAQLIDMKKDFVKKYKVESELESGEAYNFYNQFLEKLSDEYLQSTMRNLVGILIENDFFTRRQQELHDKIIYIEQLKKQQEKRNEK